MSRTYTPRSMQSLGSESRMQSMPKEARSTLSSGTLVELRTRTCLSKRRLVYQLKPRPPSVLAVA